MHFTKVSLSATQGQAIQRLPQIKDLVLPSPGVEIKRDKERRCDDGSKTQSWENFSAVFNSTVKPGTETTVRYQVGGHVELPDQVAPARSPAPATPSPQYSSYWDCLFNEGPLDCLDLYLTPVRVTTTIPPAVHSSPTCDWKNPAATRSFWEVVKVRIGQQSVDIYRVDKFDEGEKFRQQNGVARPYDVLSERKLASVLAGDVDNDGDIDVLLKFADGAYELHRQD